VQYSPITRAFHSIRSNAPRNALAHSILQDDTGHIKYRPRRQSCAVVDPFPQARGYWTLFLQKGPLASGKRGHLQPMMLRAGKS
jgi:hypothetical protein